MICLALFWCCVLLCGVVCCCYWSRVALLLCMVARRGVFVCVCLVCLFVCVVGWLFGFVAVVFEFACLCVCVYLSFRLFLARWWCIVFVLRWWRVLVVGVGCAWPVAVRDLFGAVLVLRVVVWCCMLLLLVARCIVAVHGCAPWCICVCMSCVFVCMRCGLVVWVCSCRV